MRNSFLNFDNFYGNHPILNNMAVNDYQILTVFWNIFLALSPLAFYALLKFYVRRKGLDGLKQKIIASAIFIFWLLLLPNTAYIITDARHLLNYCPIDSLHKVCVENAWMIIVFFTYSMSGWVFFYYSLKTMSDLVNKIFGKLKAYFFACLIIPAVSLGVLVGLLNRFNSWDAFAFPLLLFRALSGYFSDFYYFIDWVIFTVFLYLLYFAGDAIFKKIKI